MAEVVSLELVSDGFCDLAGLHGRLLDIPARQIAKKKTRTSDFEAQIARTARVSNRSMLKEYDLKQLRATCIIYARTRTYLRGTS